MYVPSRYNIFTHSLLPKWALAFNSLEGTFLTIPLAEVETVASILDHFATSGALPENEAAADWGRKLLAHGFVVDADRDECAIVRERYHAGRRRNRGLMLTIAPTVNCNFGCTYCFQEHPQRAMTDQEIARIRRFVEEHLEKGTALSITWFGGEPLLGFERVLELAPELRTLSRDRDCAFSQSVITNGYLLDDEKIDRLAALGDVNFVQITLDGPPSVHDQRRRLRGGQPTFERVLANIVRAAPKLPIVVRVNVDRTNADDLEALVDHIVDAGLMEKVSVYLGHTVPYTDVCAGVGESAFSRAEFAALEVRFKFRLFQRGWRRPFMLPKPGFGALCTFDSPGGYVLAPGDLVFQCWNEVAMSADAANCRLDDGLVTPAMRRVAPGWEGFDPFAHTPCDTCRVQPLCRGGCPWEALKNDAEDPGHCMTLRYNIEDMLRLYHLGLVVDTGLNEVVSSNALHA